MKKSAALFLLFIAACSSREKSYPDYDTLRNAATARCEELGHLIGSPDFYSCVGTQYTRLKQEQLY